MGDYPVEKAKMRKRLAKQARAAKLARKIVARKLKEAEKKLNFHHGEAERLQQVVNELQQVTRKNEGEFMAIPGMKDSQSWVNGIWIVAKRDGDKVLLYKFFEFLREVSGFKKLEFEIPLGPRTGEDGKEVTFNKGDMLQILYSDSLPKQYAAKHAFHFANVGPNGEVGQLQLELARHRLGMGPMPCVDPKSFLIVDGTFREVN